MKFEKISYAQFEKDSTFKNKEEIYNNLKIPCKATKGSKGYDFFAPAGFTLAPGGSLNIPTGIKCQLDDDKGLFIFPRSGLGFKYMIQLANTIGVVDVDYYGNEGNEGHIFIKLHNGGSQTVKVKAGEAFAQGIILQCFDVEDEETPSQIRKGGFGSTTTEESSTIEEKEEPSVIEIVEEQDEMFYSESEDE